MVDGWWLMMRSAYLGGSYPCPWTDLEDRATRSHGVAGPSAARKAGRLRCAAHLPTRSPLGPRCIVSPVVPLRLVGLTVEDPGSGPSWAVVLDDDQFAALAPLLDRRRLTGPDLRRAVAEILGRAASPADA